MTPEKQRVAIAKACGWTDVRYSTGGMGGYVGTTPAGGVAWPIPDYLNDLNAMYWAESMLTQEQWCESARIMSDMLHKKGHFTRHADSMERAESFLRAKGLWEESK